MNLLLFAQTQTLSGAIAPVVSALALSVVARIPETTGTEALIGALESLGEGALYDLYPVSPILLASRHRIHSTDRIA